MSLSDILNDFLEDARDQVHRFEDALVGLESNKSDRELLYKLFRVVHSLKGSSYYMGFQQLGTLLHKLENYLEPIAKGNLELPPLALDVMFKVLDFVSVSLDEIKLKGEDLPVPENIERSLKETFEQPAEKEATYEVSPILGEEQDPELFSIFLDNLHEQLSNIVSAVSAGLKDVETLSSFFERLISSSRYMDYEVLVEFFESWKGEVLRGIDQNLPVGEMVDITRKQLERLSKIVPSVDYNSLLTDLGREKAFVEKKSEEEEKSLEEISLIDKELEEAFAKWITEEQPVPEGEFVEEPVQSVQEEVIEHEPLWEEEEEEVSSQIVEEYIEPAPLVREEIVIEDEVPAQPVEMLRVDPAKVDHLLNQVGELVIRRSHFVALVAELKQIADEWSKEGILDVDRYKVLKDLWYRCRDVLSMLGRLTADLQDAVMKIRMLPLMQLFQRFPKMVRDHALQYSKSVRMVIKGGETEVDRRILEQLYEPLLHILRNAVAHGIEHPEARRSLGKPEEGTITINAYYRGQHVIIEVTDDGSGVPIDRLKSVLVEQRIYSSEEVERMSLEDLLDTIFIPGVSTAIVKDESAGRGIGLDIVREQCKRINGHVLVRSWPGEGTQFVVQIPLTLAIIPGLLVRIGKEIYTLPLASMGEVYAFDEKKVTQIKGVYFLRLEDRTVPLIFPEHLFGRRKVEKDFKRGNYIVILRTPVKEAGLVVDQFIGQQEVVIKPIDDTMEVIKNYLGATILGDGTVSLILDVQAIIENVEKFYAD